jgi:hypothetical protein
MFSWMCYILWKFRKMYMWVLRTFRVRRIISAALSKKIEMHKHNGYKTQMKNNRLMWKVVYWNLGNHNGMDLIIIGHMKKKKNILLTQKCGSKPLNTKQIDYPELQ